MKSKKKKQKSGSLNSVKRCLGCPNSENPKNTQSKIYYPIRKNMRMQAPGRANQFRKETENFLSSSKNNKIKKDVAKSRIKRGLYDVLYNRAVGYYSGFPAEVKRNENGYKWDKKKN